MVTGECYPKVQSNYDLFLRANFKKVLYNRHNFESIKVNIT